MKAGPLSHLPTSIPACPMLLPCSSPLCLSLSGLHRPIWPSLVPIRLPYDPILLSQSELVIAGLLCSPACLLVSVLLFLLSLLPLLLQSALSCLFPALNRLHYTLLLSMSSSMSCPCDDIVCVNLSEVRYLLPF